jgi:PilZ domain
VPVRHGARGILDPGGAVKPGPPRTRGAQPFKPGLRPDEWVAKGAAVSERRRENRSRRRIPCDLEYEGHRITGIVLDVSHGGLFVQTSTKLSPGTAVRVLLRLGNAPEPIAVRCSVARQRSVPPRLASVARPGVGLRLLEAPPEYFAALSDPSFRPEGQGAADPEPAAGSPRFRVRVKQSGGSRSRTIEIAAESAELATAQVLSEIGEGWEVIETEAA